MVFAKAIPDQKAERIVQILSDDVSSLVAPLQRLHSDQGKNFESCIFADICKAFGIKKTCTTPWDGLVEGMNRLFLTLIRSYVDREED